MATIFRQPVVSNPHLFRPRPRSVSLYTHIYLALALGVPSVVDTTHITHQQADTARWTKATTYQSVGGTPLALRTAAPAARPFFQINWPNPRGAQRSVVDWVVGSLPLPLAPPAESDTTHLPNPLPADQRWQDTTSLTTVYGSTRLLTGEVAAAPPFTQTSWPNPRGAARAVADWQTFGLPLPLTTHAPPFIQRDWPNPRGVERHPDWIAGLSTALLTSRPFVQSDWPVPPGPKRPVQDWQQSYPLTFTTSGFNQYDWPVPKGPQPLNRGFTDSFKLPLQTIVGSNQYDWPVPKGAKPNQPLGFTSEGLARSTVVVYPATITFDWPNPRGPQPLNRGFTDSFKLPLQTIVGSNQYSWPNPRGAARPVTDWVTGTPYSLASAVAPPFHQTDWPVPRGAKGKVSDWQDSFKLPLTTHKPPFTQYDWPVPKGAKGVAGFVNPSLNFQVTFNPFRQMDWPVPRGAKPKVQDWTDSFKLTLTTHRPFSQREWPVPQGARRSGDLGFINQIADRAVEVEVEAEFIVAGNGASALQSYQVSFKYGSVQGSTLYLPTTVEPPEPPVEVVQPPKHSHATVHYHGRAHTSVRWGISRTVIARGAKGRTNLRTAAASHTTVGAVHETCVPAFDSDSYDDAFQTCEGVIQTRKTRTTPRDDP